MKKFQWIGLTMLGFLVLLGACNQAEEPEAPAEQNTEGKAQTDETDEPSTEDNQENDQLIDIAENFIHQLQEGNYDKATEQFDEVMTEQLSPDDLEELWSDLENQMGDFTEQTYDSTGEMDGYQLVFITGTFENAEVTFQVTFDEHQHIAGFYVQ